MAEWRWGSSLNHSHTFPNDTPSELILGFSILPKGTLCSLHWAGIEPPTFRSIEYTAHNTLHNVMFLFTWSFAVGVQVSCRLHTTQWNFWHLMLVVLQRDLWMDTWDLSCNSSPLWLNKTRVNLVEHTQFYCNCMIDGLIHLTLELNALRNFRSVFRWEWCWDVL